MSKIQGCITAYNASSVPTFMTDVKRERWNSPIPSKVLC